MYCSECGNKVGDGVKYCPLCGKPISYNGDLSRENVELNETQGYQTKNNSTLFIVLYFLAIVFNIIALIINLAEVASSELKIYDAIYIQAQVKPIFYFFIFIIFISVIVQILFTVDYFQQKKNAYKSFIISMITFMVCVVSTMVSFSFKYVIDERPDICIVDSPGVFITAGILSAVLLCIIIPLTIKGKKIVKSHICNNTLLIY